ncbi:MAG TPA: FAD-dependent oxidoreductase, partial [Pseudomonadales bacterium]|nr:FAD-dependent oxidoreductase [Pseudomonadales bacterium]
MGPLVIIGTGLAGYNLAKEWRKLDTARELIMLTADDGRNYSKPMLSTGFTKSKTADELAMADASTMASQLNAKILTHTKVESINTHDRTLKLSNGDALVYGDLVLAWGADVVRVPLEGDGLDLVYSVNDLEDYARFRTAIAGKKKIVIMGAGLIGCEFANDLSNGGYQVEVVDPVGRCLPALLPEAASKAVQTALEGMGVKFHMGPLVKAVNQTANGAAVVLSNGDVLDADIVVSAIGLRPRVQLAKEAGIQVNRGIVVNKALHT